MRNDGDLGQGLVGGADGDHNGGVPQAGVAVQGRASRSSSTARDENDIG